jgi:aminoglycoside phosphotransferase (APT) family kinase protein
LNDDRQQVLLEALERDGVIKRRTARFTPLTGGVSSEIHRVDDGDRIFVVKRALPRLLVQEEWYADVTRNRHEVDYLRYVGQFLPEVVPKVLGAGDGYFVMEFLGTDYRNWKVMLLEREGRVEHARKAGRILGAIHGRSAGDDQARRTFNTLRHFRELRIDPYLRTAAGRNPSVASQLEAEAERLETWGECLVHGDFSPKNILVSFDRMVVLDCEVACYGDPAFDLAFLINHLCLKALHHHPNHRGFREMIAAVWQAHRAAWPQADAAVTALERRVGWLLPMLMLARVDGKSPAEYIVHNRQRTLIRRFAQDQLGHAPRPIDVVSSAWFRNLDQFPS